MDEKKENVKGKQIKKALALTGTTQQELATKLGITQGTLTQWVNGRRNPSFETVERIAEALDVPVGFLLSDKIETTQDFLNRTSKQTEFIPVLGLSSATNEKFILEENEETYIRFPKTGEHQFAIKVEGNCMENPKDLRNSIFDGDYIIIDPDVTPRNGDVVLARISAEYSTIKRMYIDEDTVELIPDNPDCKKLVKQQSDVEIVGKVVNVFRPIKRVRKRVQ